MEESAPPKPEKNPPPPAGEEAPLVFYYSRARRLERASAAVRALNEESPAPRRGLFRVLTATGPLRFLFISLALSVAILYLGTFFGRDKEAALGGNGLSFSALRFEGFSYIVLKKSALPDQGAYTGLVDMVISPVLSAGEPPLASRSILFSAEPEEEFRFSVPFEGPELLVLMRAGEEYGNFKVKAD